MAAISGRRGPVIGVGLLVWLVVLALAVAAHSRPRRAGRRASWLGLSVVYLPLVLLVGAALEPSQGAEQAAGRCVGAPLLAALTLARSAATGRWRSPRASTVLAYAVDVIAGSPLTSLSLLGPNPGLGVRFYGIGNELEALLGVLVVAGTGRGAGRVRAAALAPAGCGVAFLAVGLPLRRSSSPPGRFGADVGAAIVFPVGAAVAAAAIAARRAAHGAAHRRGCRSWPWRCSPLVDLVSGRQRPPDPLGARRRRARRPRRGRPAPPPALRPQLHPPDRLRLPAADRRSGGARGAAPRPAARLAARTARRCGPGCSGRSRRPSVGTLANDSGALMLEIGAAYLLVFAASPGPMRRTGAIYAVERWSIDYP